MRYGTFIAAKLLLLVTILCQCASVDHSGRMSAGAGSSALLPTDSLGWQELVATRGRVLQAGQLEITYPYDGAVFPPEIAAPTIRWTDNDSSSVQWLLVFSFGDRRTPLYALAQQPQWAPDKATWEAIKAGCVAAPAELAVFGVGTAPVRLTSQGSIHFSTSTDPVDASILYRQVPLPFKTSDRALRKMKWRLGSVASYEPPAVVMQNLSACASCHQVSRDGRLISMEMNYKGDSGAQFIAPVAETISLSPADFMTWQTFPKPDLLPRTRGVFAKLSPGGNYLAGTVNEIAFFALTNDPAFCQLFFPTYGILAWYDVQKRVFHTLPGADSLDYVQTDPSWSWDEKQIVFARTRTRKEYHEDITNIRTRIEDADIHTLNRKYPMQFDLYRIAFNQGRGGVPEPLSGASNNGMSNYFGRFSPDGRWIVFTRSRWGIMLQPDSELFIIPAVGGRPRRMRCNRERLNSWHSFSPNGKWMLFSSKANSDFTEIFLTHIDENGMDSPPVCLSRFSHSRYAANVPEFVNIPAGAIRRIVLTQ